MNAEAIAKKFCPSGVGFGDTHNESVIMARALLMATEALSYYAERCEAEACDIDPSRAVKALAKIRGTGACDA